MELKQFDIWLADLKQDCDILVDQFRAIDNKRLIKKIGELPDASIKTTMRT